MKPASSAHLLAGFRLILLVPFFALVAVLSLGALFPSEATCSEPQLLRTAVERDGWF